MANHRCGSWRRRLLVLFGLLFLLFAVLMVDPYPRQTLFGPTIHGEPLCVWEDAVRRYANSDSFNTSFIGKLYRWLEWKPASFEFDDPEMATVYANLLADRDPEVRYTVLRALCMFEKARHPIQLPALRRTLEHDPDSSRRMLAAEAIWKIDADKKLTDALFQGLENRKSKHREKAMSLLRPICTVDPNLIERTKPYAMDHDNGVRAQAMFAMGEFGTPGVSTLIHGLNDDDFGTVWAAAWALAKIGPEAKEALPTLERAFIFRKFPPTGECGTYSALSAVGHALRAIDPNYGYIQAALKKELLTSMGTTGLEEWLDDENEHRCNMATELLLMVDPVRYKHLSIAK